MSANNFSSNVPAPPHKEMAPKLVGYITCFTWLTVKQAKAEYEYHPVQSVLIEQYLQIISMELKNITMTTIDLISSRVNF